MNAITSFRLCKLSSHELVEKLDKLTDEMFESQKVPTRHIPARPDADYDLLVGELILRFQELEEFIKSIENDLCGNVSDDDDNDDDDVEQDLGQLVFDTKRKISKFLATEYGS